MRYHAIGLVVFCLSPLLSPLTLAQATAPTTRPVGKLPFMEVDLQKKQVRIETEVIGCQAALEFFAVSNGGPDHEAILRSPVRPQHMHLGLLMLGLRPGELVGWSATMNKWTPPKGPPLRISVEYVKEGKTITAQAYQWMREVKTKQPCRPITWVFTGSRLMDNGVYAADGTGYLVSVVNFELTPIDIPELASSANETLEWEANLEMVPPTGTKVTMIIEPVEKKEDPPIPTSRPQPVK